MSGFWHDRPVTLGDRLRRGRLSFVVVALLLAGGVAAVPTAHAQSCAGDCDGDGSVTDGETLLGANLALGTLAVRSCPSADLSGDGTVRVSETVASVANRLAGCTAPRKRAAARPRTASPQIELGVVSGSAGAVVSFDATFRSMGNDVAGIQVDIGFDPLTPVVSCENSFEHDKDIFVGFQPPGCTPGTDCTAVRVLVLSLSDVDPLPADVVLFRCSAAISFVAPDATYPLDAFNDEAATPDGEPLPLDGIDGAVNVAGGALCGGDCDNSNAVTINELIIGINILLGNQGTIACPVADLNGNARVTVDESIAATGNAHEGCGTHPTGPPAAQTVSIQVGVVSGTAGTQVAVDATLHTNGEAVAGTQNDIFFDPTTPIASTINGRPDCSNNPAIDKAATSFAFLPNGCSVGFDCTGIRTFVSAFDNFDPIPDGSVLYTCRVDISPFADEGSHPLSVSLASASTPGGRPISAFGIDGAVISTGGEIPPTPTPTPEDDTTIVVGDAAGIAGQITTLSVGLTTNAEIAGVQNDMTFDPTTPIVFSSCAVNPDIDKEQTFFGFRPFDCVPGVNCSGVRALVLSFSNVDPIPDGSIMYSCDVFILPSADPGDYPLVCSNEGVSDPNGNALDVECTDGTVSVLTDGPPVAPASLILQKARLRFRARTGGSLLLTGAVNANPPFGSLAEDVLASGLSVRVSGAGGAETTLTWSAAQCSARQTGRGPKIRCETLDNDGKRRIVLTPSRIPNLLRMKIKASLLSSLVGPFTAEPVSANLQTTSFQRPDTIGDCEVKHQGAVVSCRESGLVP